MKHKDERNGELYTEKSSKWYKQNNKFVYSLDYKWVECLESDRLNVLLVSVLIVDGVLMGMLPLWMSYMWVFCNKPI